MANVIIKKRVKLDFLGEDYSEGYLDFRAAGIDELAGIEKQAEKAKSEEDSLKFIKDFLGDKLLGGKFPNIEDNNELEDFGKDDIGKLDPETIMVVFQVLGGGLAADPKES